MVKLVFGTFTLTLYQLLLIEYFLCLKVLIEYYMKYKSQALSFLLFHR